MILNGILWVFVIFGVGFKDPFIPQHLMQRHKYLCSLKTQGLKEEKLM